MAGKKVTKKSDASWLAEIEFPGGPNLPRHEYPEVDVVAVAKHFEPLLGPPPSAADRWARKKDGAEFFWE